MHEAFDLTNNDTLTYIDAHVAMMAELEAANAAWDKYHNGPDKSSAFHRGEGQLRDARVAVYAAVAQAQELRKIREVMETLLDDMCTATRRTVFEEWDD